MLYERWRRARRFRHAGGETKPPCGAVGKIHGIER